MKIKFTKPVKVISQGIIKVNYKAGDTADLPPPSARKWLRRDAAVEIVDGKPEKIAPKDDSNDGDSESGSIETAAATDSPAEPADDSKPIKRKYTRRPLLGDTEKSS